MGPGRESEVQRGANALLVESVAALRDFVADAEQHNVIAIDIESNGFYNYRERTCVLTASTPVKDYVIDTLELWDHCSMLARIFNDPDTQILVHGGSYDISSLKRDWGFHITNVFDSNIAAQLLELKEQGLAGLVREYFGVSLPKELQRYDWTQRPLKPEHMSYLAGDTHFLFALKDILMGLIEEKDLAEEFEIECRLLADQPPAPQPGVDPEDYRRIRGARELNDTQRGTLRALFLLRDEMSRESDLAPFRVMSNNMLIQLSRVPPATLHDVEDLRGINRSLRDRYAERILDVVREGRRQPQPRRLPRANGADDDDREDFESRRLTPQQRQLEKDLKTWRREEALARGVGMQAVLPTSVLTAIVRELPTNETQLGSYPRLGAKRLQRYGEPILQLVRRLTL